MSPGADLEGERDFLLASLRDLEAERQAGEVAEEDYRELRDRYTARAAAVLRSLETGEGATAPAAADGRRQPPDRPLRRRAVVVTAAVAAGVVAVTVAAVIGFAGPREAGQPLSGSVPQGAAGRMAEAIQLERGGRALDALKAYDAVLAEDPDNVEALSYRGWLLKRAGLIDEALASLDRAVAVAPRYPDAHFFRGMVLYQDRNDPAGAVEEFRSFLDNGPPESMVPMVRQVLERAAADAEARASADK